MVNPKITVTEQGHEFGKPGQTGSGTDGFDRPTGIAFAPNGDIFVSDFDGGGVYSISLSNLTVELVLPSNFNFTGMVCLSYIFILIYVTR